MAFLCDSGESFHSTLQAAVQETIQHQPNITATFEAVTTSQGDTYYVYRNVVRFIEDHGPPADIYNVATGNIGVSKALQEFDLVGKTFFSGQELNANSRLLLERSVMNVAIGHNIAQKIEEALDCVRMALDGRQILSPPRTRVLIHTKYNCI